jgi:opacity protein-like surface antigen
MKMKSVALAALCYVSLAAAANAACVVNIVRTACAGQEAVSYSKCNGKKACDKEESSGVTAKACEQAAASNCPNSRLTITKSKVVTAKFNGKALRGGANFCAANRPDFNKCAK